MLLERKTAIIYGGAGAIGRSVAHAFAREGARVFLAGRTEESLARVVEAVRTGGGTADYAVVNALDKESVERFQGDVVANAGSLDISFNVIGLDDVQGSPLTAMAETDFTAPHGRDPLPDRPSRSHPRCECWRFRRRMRGDRRVVSPTGVRSGAARRPRRMFAVGGIARCPGVDEVFRKHAANQGISRQAFERKLAEDTLLKRLPRLTEVADAAVLAASDKASAITGAIFNVTCGEIVD